MQRQSEEDKKVIKDIAADVKDKKWLPRLTVEEYVASHT